VLRSLAPYVQLHRLLINNWETLDKFGTYKFMIKPLRLER